MKNIFRLITMTALSAAVVCGCSKREVLVGQGGHGTGDGTMGYVRIAEDCLTVEFDGERINNSGKGSESTRATADDVDNFWVEILDTEGSPVDITVNGSTAKSFTYGQLQQAEGGVIALPLGTYTMRAYSGDSFEIASKVYWEGEDKGQPSWAGESQEFTIIKTNTKETPHEAVNVQCTLQTVKVTVVLEQGLASSIVASTTNVSVIVSDSDKYDHDYENNLTALYTNNLPHQYGLGSFNISSSDKLEDTPDVTRQSAVCYMTTFGEEANTLFVNVKGDYIKNVDLPAETSPLDATVKIASGESGVNPGEWRKIWLYLEAVDEATGRITIGARIETWVYDEQVTVDVSRAVTEVGERKILDYAPSKLSIVSSALNLNGETTVDKFGSTGLFTGNAAMSIRLNTGEAVSKFAVKMSTRNSGFITELEDYNVIDTWIDLADSSNKLERAQFILWGFPDIYSMTRAGDVEFDLKPFFEDIYKHGSDTYTIAFDIESGNYYYKAELKLNVKTDGESGGDGDGEISITWPGYDMSIEHTITDDMTCEIVVKASKGIAKLMGTLKGAIADEIGEDGIVPLSFDLCDPDKYKEGLAEALSKSFNIPCGDDVKNHTDEVKLNISDFLVIFPTGSSQFVLDLTDNAGATASATIKLKK